MVIGDSSAAEQQQQDPDDSDSEFVEVDPTARYGRYKEILGKGAFKTVYRAFDELEGIEVAWNQVKLADLLRNAEDLERLYSEVHLLKTLKHKNIIKMYNSWVDTRRDNVNFITEIFTSGTLRQYRKKHKHVDLRALKNWSRQILQGLLYLHSHDPPVIHRDLKCDNIFVNGNQGEVKIGDLGLAAILQKANSAHSVIGTPEFMAPELYEEEYNELVDIYAFGMCLLELVTFEYPYVECANAAQIYKKVTSGIKPASLEKVQDPGVKRFIEKCIAKASLRLCARELLIDPFLRLDGENESVSRPQQPGSSNSVACSNVNVGQSNVGTNSSAVQDEIPESSRDFMVEGQRKDVNTIFLKLRIADSTGHVRNIHFPFDTEIDTAFSVATEMVSELDLTDQDVTTVATMIDSEIQAHIPEWLSRKASKDNPNGKLTVSDKCEFETEDELSLLASDSDPSSSGLVLERLPSGRRYWSDPPKNLSGGSPSRSSRSDFSSPPHDSVNVSSVFSEGHGEFLDGDEIDERKEFDLPVDSQSYENQNAGVVKQHHIDSTTASVEKVEISANDELKYLRITEEKLEHILAKQKKELDEIKRKHKLAISDLLKELTPEIRHRVLDTCLLKFPEYKMQLRFCHSQQILSHVYSSHTYNSSSPQIDDSPNKARPAQLQTSASFARIIGRVGSQESLSENNGGRPNFRDRSKSNLKGDPKSCSTGIAVILGDGDNSS